MLTEYQGPSNKGDIFRYLVGETIKACFVNSDGKIHMVLGSGEAIVFSGAAFWKESAVEVASIVKARRDAILAKIAELRDLPGIDLPGADLPHAEPARILDPKLLIPPGLATTAESAIHEPAKTEPRLSGIGRPRAESEYGRQ